MSSIDGCLGEYLGLPPIESIFVGEREDKADAGTAVDRGVQEGRQLVKIGIERSGWWPRLNDVIRHAIDMSLGQVAEISLRRWD